MGALTSKTYTYKGRPWELRSKDTISLKDPFLPNIRAQIIHKKILRILPVVGEEEWLGNHSRFFESRSLNTTYLGVLYPKWKSKLMKNTIKESDGYQRALFLEKTLTSMSMDIQEKRELAFILGPETDITTLDAIKQLDNLTPAIKIISIIPNAKKEIQNATLAEEDLKNKEMLLMTSKYKNSPLFSAKLDDLIEDGGTLSTFKLSSSKNTLETVYGVAKWTLKNLNTGSNRTKMQSLTFLSPYLENYLSSNTERFFFADPVNSFGLIRNSIQEIVSSSNILTSISNINLSNNTETSVYYGGPSANNLLHKDIIIPTLSFWNEARIYRDFFGKTIETPITLNISTNISFVDAIMALQKKLFMQSFLFVSV